ncbi:steroid delta-isomerase [Nocardia cyriacigeorgica]|uniref:Steroid Delta-isomerase (Delta(5)-3-ketosteroid isomerase) n=2 Tax=Nocardia cyriacigeorgica TaxID=135487 RepID=H6R6N2_NOCCG|nr:nuclear transport factor 2 family protein [Nocardia cyriacigeorgica]NEW35407.1 steroid delta-isomerase [Nocardia cyriacigeorgica]BDT85764.1 steroid Delta-isomerase [Nocardia cyriacigeorgica]BDU05290.1 steroid Delta-isomerase [Nocardia cyriacigeorgica]CCF62195.1 Steroid Delta-isomerase (Delta(5)-3-ketosteroid isomerase) [Nocardia cyriacigeorgica GUH-2]
MARQIRDVVEQYVKLVGSGPTDDIVALYAPDAIVEDPIGTPPKQGHDAIREFYNILANLERETSIHPDTVRIVGNHAAFMFTLVTIAGGQRMTLHPIDVMEFDDEGRITRMRAYWGQDDLTMEPAGS